MEKFEILKPYHTEHYQRFFEHQIYQKKYPNIRMLSALTLTSQECARRALSWNIIYLEKDITALINPEVLNLLLQYNNLVLAGGAVIDLLQDDKPRDYDLFMIGDNHKLLSFIRCKYEHVETINAISITINDTDVQFIKRVYDNPIHIIGGFDLDVCRFAYQPHCGAYCTIPAYFTLNTGQLIVHHPR